MSALEAGEFECELNGVRIHYTVRGEGPVIIAHSGGPGGDARMWMDLAGIDDFAKVVIIHPRGSGLSGDAPEPNAYMLSDFAGDVEALRELLGIQRPTMMGWSHGGMVVQQHAVEYPQSVSKLILYDTSAYFGEFLEDVEAAVRQFVDEPWYEASLEALQKEWAGEYESAEEMGALWAEEMKFYFKEFGDRERVFHEKTMNLLFRIDSLKAFNELEADDMDLRDNLRSVEIPTLIIVGRHDFITTVAMAEEMDKILPDSRLEVFENSGHFVHVEQREEFYRVVKEFVLGST